MIQGPLVFPAGGLNKSHQVGFRNVQAREPHHLWLTLINLQSQRQSVVLPPHLMLSAGAEALTGQSVVEQFIMVLGSDCC